MKEKSEALEVLTKDQAQSIDRVKTYHFGCIKAFGDQMGYAFLAGLELNALRDEIETKLGYGHFTKIRESHLPEIPNGSAYRYMDFQKKLVELFPRVGKLKALTNGKDLDEEDRDQVLKAVHKMTDGKTLTQLYRDLGVIRDKDHQKHTPAKEVSAEDALAARLEGLKAIFARARESLQLIRELPAEDLGIIPRELWSDHLSACVQSAKHARPILRGLKKSKKKKS